MQRFEIDEDAEVLDKFRDDFEILVYEAEDIALKLEAEPDNQELVIRLVRYFKQLYSQVVNANIAPLVEPLAILDDFLEIIKWQYRKELSYPLTLLLDRYLLMANEAADNFSINFQLITDIQRSMQVLARVKSSDEVGEAIPRVIDVLLGGYSNTETDNSEIELFDDIELFGSEPEKPAQPTNTNPPSDYIGGQAKHNTQKQKRVKSSEEDLLKLEMQILMTPSVYRALADLIDTRQRYWVGRSYFLISLAMRMNAEAKNIVDPLDLTNAIYLHDFPMLQLSDEILYGRDIDKKDFKRIQQHPESAFEIAKLLGSSTECAEMVLQHHERYDGKGYPNKLKGSEICHGAKIIAICDAYYSMTNVKAYRENQRSPLRSVAEINACSGTQFDPLWVKVFNRVAKKYRLLENV